MKIAISAHAPSLDAEIDDSFGRAYWFILYDDQTDTWEPLDNSDTRNAANHCGVRAARTLADYGVDQVLTGETGPKAFRTLADAGIAVCQGVTGNVKTALRTYREGSLTPARGANSQGSPDCLMATERISQQPRRSPGAGPRSVFSTNNRKEQCHAERESGLKHPPMQQIRQAVPDDSGPGGL